MCKLISFRFEPYPWRNSATGNGLHQGWPSGFPSLQETSSRSYGSAHQSGISVVAAVAVPATGSRSHRSSCSWAYCGVASPSLSTRRLGASNVANVSIEMVDMSASMAHRFASHSPWPSSQNQVKPAPAHPPGRYRSSATSGDASCSSTAASSERVQKCSASAGNLCSHDAKGPRPWSPSRADRNPLVIEPVWKVHANATSSSVSP